ncbi:MAG: DUF2569 family protein [Vicinamibacterales bacterium]|nr:DUF2569 family protein [Vicinamibacterales bacterium]
MVVPRHDRVNDEADHIKSGVGGWLLLLCLLLLVGQPVNLAIGAARALGSLPMRGLPLALVVLGQLMVAGIGVAAGLALLGCRRGAATFAKSSLLLSAAMDLFVYSTPFLPNNRLPGTTPLFVIASLAYYAVWIAYLSRSKRVRNTFSAVRG